MNVLVTGAKGFAGSALTRALVADDSVDAVVCLDIKDTPGRLVEVRESIKLLAGGVGEVEELAALMTRHAIDAVAHMVFFASDPRQAEQINVEVEAMVRGAANVIEAARRVGAARVVLPSSVHYYGPQWRHGEVPLSEDAPGYADTLYGTGKRFLESVARTYNTRSDLEVVSFRIPGVYGPGAKVGARGVNVPAVAAASGQPGRVPYGPDERVCAAHVDDVAEVLRLGLTAEHLEYDVYNIGGETVSYRQLRNFARQVVPDAQIRFTDVEGPIDLPYLIDDSRLRREFGFEHKPLGIAYREFTRSMLTETEGSM